MKFPNYFKFINFMHICKEICITFMYNLSIFFAQCNSYIYSFFSIYAIFSIPIIFTKNVYFLYLPPFVRKLQHLFLKK